MWEWIVRVLESIIGETTSVMPERAVIAVGFMILVGLVIFMEEIYIEETGINGRFNIE